jgi:hypothetical protein
MTYPEGRTTERSRLACGGRITERRHIYVPGFFSISFFLGVEILSILNYSLFDSFNFKFDLSFYF